jgi:hypothetical protein
VILHSTDVYIQLNINQSPFNVGLPIELSEFTQEQVLEFVQQYSLELDKNLLDSLIALVGGHPYLLELAFAHLKGHPEITLEQILAGVIRQLLDFISCLGWLVAVSSSSFGCGCD